MKSKWLRLIFGKSHRAEMVHQAMEERNYSSKRLLEDVKTKVNYGDLLVKQLQEDISK